MSARVPVRAAVRAAVCAGACAWMGLPASVAADAVDAEDSAVERAVFDAVNEWRRAEGLEAYTWRDEIAEQARAHSEAMATGRVGFGHDGFQERAQAIAAKGSLASAAENISRHTRSADEVPAAVLAGWLASPVHRKNLSAPHPLSGLGASRAADGVWFLTQIYVTP